MKYDNKKKNSKNSNVLVLNFKPNTFNLYDSFLLTPSIPNCMSV